MKTVNVLGKYNVYIGSGLTGNIPELLQTKNYSKVIVVTDANLPEKYLKDYEKIIVSSGEKSKTIETVQTIWKEMLRLKADRKSLVLNFGGGVIGDMGGFAASCYMRGVKFVQIPTTLLSAVDASVGGKVGIDFTGVKNLIGSFNQPEAVIIDTDTFKTLPDREFVSGFGEIIKHGLIYDTDYFNTVTSKKPRDFSEEELTDIIAKSCEIKAGIISSDEKESGNRKLLNFGHTIGHALESLSLDSDNYLLHGEAVSIGMVAEAKASVLSGLINEGELKNIEEVLLNAGLPISIEISDPEKVLELISNDKKSDKGQVKWTLLKGLGQAIIDRELSPEILRKSLEYISGKNE